MIAHCSRVVVLKAALSPNFVSLEFLDVSGEMVR